MASRVEQQVGHFLSTILANLPNGATIPDSEQFRDALSGLEAFIPGVLGELHPEWTYESLDGILPLVARKTREGEAEIFGECILTSDQTRTPIHLRLQTSTSGDEISWLELRLGELGEHGLLRTPYESANTANKRVYGFSEQGSDASKWAYEVTFADRRP
jgi:hypothetical protein